MLNVATAHNTEKNSHNHKKKRLSPFSLKNNIKNATHKLLCQKAVKKKAEKKMTFRTAQKTKHNYIN